MAFVTVVLLFGILFTLTIGVIERNINMVFGVNGILAMSFIGTPIHELSHYIACKIFRHKVTHVCLWSPRKFKQNGQLGYVQHAYNPKSVYQNAGNFIIGAAPVLSAAGISYLIMRFLFGMSFHVEDMESIDFESVIEYIKGIFLSLNANVNSEFFSNPLFWIGLVLFICIFLNVALSKADFKNAYVGILFFIVLAPIFGLVLNMFGVGYPVYISIYLKFDIFITLAFAFGLIILVILLLISLLLRIIKRRARH